MSTRRTTAPSTETVRRTAVAGLLALAVLGGTATAGTAATAAPPASAVVATAATKAPATDFGFLRRITRTSKGTTLTLDRAVLHTGAAAKAQQAARGLDTTPDYYVQNDNPLLRTFRVAPGVKVYGSQVLTGSPARKRISLNRLRAYLSSRPKGRTGPPFTLVFDRRHRVVSIAEVYLP